MVSQILLNLELKNYKTILNHLNFSFMKKIILLILLSFISFAGFAQDINEGFEGAPATADGTGAWALPTSAGQGFGSWLVRDNRTNAGINWRSGVAPLNPPNTGTTCATVDRENTGAGVYAEEWLITPQINVAANRQLRFFTRQGFSGDLGTRYQIRMSTSANQADLSAYTVTLADYSEFDLSTITPDQQDYEEKIINLTGITGLRYFAFVKVFTQPLAQTSGDKWLIDDVRTIERCVDPITPLGAPVISSTTATLSWTMPGGSTQTTFEVEVGISGFTQGGAGSLGVFPATTTTANPRTTIYGDDEPPLLPGTAYQFFVRSTCSGGNTSGWTGPFNFTTNPLGSVCSDPYIVTPLPFSHTSNTNIYGNNITPTTPTTCGVANTFMGGNDVVYSYTVPATTTGIISIDLNPNGQANTAVFVYNSCASIGTSCIAAVGNNTGGVRSIPVLNVTAGQTIFIVVSSTAAVGTFAYTLTIQDVNCAPPTDLTAAAIDTTNVTIGWQGTAPGYQYYVQTAGSTIPSGAGTANTTTSATVNQLTESGTPLAVGNNYQFWVRADCGDGTWSQWAGPYPFTTTSCTTGGCSYSFVMTDSFGDGWNGATMEVIQNNVTVATIGSTFTDGNGPITVSVPLCNNVPFTLRWATGGNFPGEVAIAIVNSFGQTIFFKPNGTGSAPSNLFTATVDCTTPLCLPPTLLVSSNPTPNGIQLNWTPNGPTPVGGYDVYVVTPPTAPAPTGATPPTYSGVANGFVIDATSTPSLTPDTNYIFYVRASCGAGTSSTWSIPTTANPATFTTLPTCPKPTNGVLSNFNEFSMDFSWTPGFNETSWQYYVTLAGDPPPAADALEWSAPVSTTTVPLTFLPSGTCFDVYVRGICTPDTDISTAAGPFTGCTLICQADQQCPYTFTMTDSFGDGWNGARMEVRQNDVVIATLGANFTAGAGPVVVTVPLCNGVPFDLVWTTGGTFPGEVRIAVTNSFDQTLYAMTTASTPLVGTTLYSGMVDCINPACLPPNALTASDPTPHGATLTWTQNGNVAPLSWSIYAVTSGSPVPVPGTDTPIAVVTDTDAIPPYVLNDPSILADTDYVYYIVANCDGANPTSPISAVSTVFHTLPTCPKPTALSTLNPDMNSIDFTWTPGGTETAWEYIWVPAGDPAPTASSTGWIPTTNTTVSISPLASASAFDFYVRGICTPDTDISTISGPATGNTTICPAEDQCNYTFTLTDSFGDGWNGARMQVRQNGIVVATLGANFTGGAGPIVVTVPICPGVPLDLFWVTAGTFPGEVRINVTNSFNQTIYAITTASGGLAGTVLFANADPSCTVPLCQAPAVATLDASPSIYNATLTWNSILGVTYDIYLVPQGDPAPTNTSTPNFAGVTAPFITPGEGELGALSPLSNYTFYVRMVCPNDPAGHSPWSPGFNFTTLPTCPTPQNITVSSNTTSATITFTEMGPATSWAVTIYQLGAPLPGMPIVVTQTPVGGVVSINTALSIAEGGLGLTLFPGLYDFTITSVCSPTDSSLPTPLDNFFILPVETICASVTPQNPDINGDNVINLCPGETCVPLTAEYTENKATTSYVVESIPFAPPFPFDGGEELNIAIDDIWGPVFDLPFQFCFFGTNYDNVQVGSNGVLSFGSNFPALVGGGCPWNTDPGTTVPNAAFPIRNAIYGVYQDIDPSEETSVPHTINYQVIGTEPCRTFVLNYVNLGQFQCGEDVGLQTSQIVLYETSNIIEVYVKDRTSCAWNEGSGVIGIQNAAGTLGYTPPGRNLGPWEAHNEAWQFKPDGASNVVFSWLKDGEFYSNDTAINVCVSETTNMTAQAVYTGCGGVVTTKTSDVLLKINEIDVSEVQDVATCNCYTLPTLSVGNYFAQPGGVDPIPAGTEICSTQTIYVYAELVTTGATCTDEASFTVTINPLLPIEPADVSACTNYTLPDLGNANFNYYTGPNGSGTMYAGTGGDVISTSTTLYVYASVGGCTAEDSFEITIGDVEAPTIANIADCLPVTLPALLPNTTYYTLPGGPNAAGQVEITDFVITGTQTIYVWAQSGDCTDESSFIVTINSQLTPTFPAIANPCVGDVPPVLPLISIEGVIGTWDAVVSTDTAGTTTYTFTPSLAFPCAVSSTITVTVNAPTQPTFNPIADVCVGAASPALPGASLEGIAGTWSPATVDTSVAGTTCYTFTPTQSCFLPATLCVTVSGQILPTFDPIANFCQNTTAPQLPLQSLNGILGSWTPATIDGTTAGTATYTFNPDTTLSPCAIQTTITVTVDPSVLPTFNPIADICQNSTAPTLPTTSIEGITGIWGTIDTATTGSQVISFTPDAGQLCALPTTMTVNVIAPLVPNFVDITICHSTPAPVLAGTSPNGITGSWFPATISNTLSGTYTFTPNIACALQQTINVTVTPQVSPDFAPIANICSGATAPTLATTAPNGITGTWSPATVSNTQSGCYVFTPNAGQCSQPQTVCVTVDPTLSPNFAEIGSICSGSTAPLLATSSNGVTGTWSPATVSNTQSGSYVFTPDAGQCAVGQTLNVTVITLPEIDFNVGCVGANYMLSVKDPIEGASYSWEFNDVLINNTAAQGPGINLTLLGKGPGQYTVNVMVGTCPTEESIAIMSVSCDIQKGISPRGTGAGDNKNDFFDLAGQNVKKLEIFNRYGTKVYSKANYINEWYGQSDKGEELPDATYFYVIEYNTGGSAKTGWIYINREQ
jgi:gliding motility-associated-like protein